MRNGANRTISFLTLFDNTTYSRGVFRTLANIYGGAFSLKQSTAKSFKLLLQNAPSQMLGRVLNTPLCSKTLQVSFTSLNL